MSKSNRPVALVTGASKGIGLRTAQALSADGYEVVTAQRTIAPGLASIMTDLTKPGQPEQVLNHFKRLDVLINNAGMMIEDTTEQTSLEDWDKQILLNLTVPFLLIKAALPKLRESTQAAIVNVGSIEGLASNPHHPAYCASKAGLHGLTRAVAVDHGPQGIRCNAVAPGWIDTDTKTQSDFNVEFNNDLTNADAFPNPRLQPELAKTHPLIRTGRAEEVAATIAWLASPKSSFITGQVIPVDGGHMADLSLP